MAHYIDANQLAEICRELGLVDQERALIDAAQIAGTAIAGKLGVRVVMAADNLPGMGGLCVGFGPEQEGDPCPDAIIDYDDCSDWGDATRKAKG